MLNNQLIYSFCLGSNRINITNTGKLTVKDFLEPLSGLYTCSFSYKTIKAETQEEKVVKQRYDFMIFGKNIGTFSLIHLVWIRIKYMISSFSVNESVIYNRYGL